MIWTAATNMYPTPFVMTEENFKISIALGRESLKEAIENYLDELNGLDYTESDALAEVMRLPI